MYHHEAMTPLELELYSVFQRNVGIRPENFEFIFMVDADTIVERRSLNQLVSHMVRNTRIGGITGDVQLANEKESFVTMIQVYEYFVSQHMVKAFESLFGYVTCLPGCFSLYRIRTKRGKPLIIDKSLVRDYGVNEVDTLHLKNLLYLGEDRYLTTLIMKYFPTHKTAYQPDAKAFTVAPATFSILFSQRRRWINSTVHNLFELMGLKHIAACCCSMRVVIFLDLLATVTQPAVIVYIVYIVTIAVTDPDAVFPLISVIMLSAVFGLQMLLFLMKLKIENLGWMIAVIDY
jgi:chitin synthase